MSTILQDFTTDGLYKLRDVNVMFLLAEASSATFTIAELNFFVDASGNLKQEFEVRTTPITQYKENVYIILYDVVFYILLIININLFFTDEINLYKKRKRWQEVYFKNLSESEKV